jgi:hypothetical protein
MRGLTLDPNALAKLKSDPLDFFDDYGDSFISGWELIGRERLGEIVGGEHPTAWPIGRQWPTGRSADLFARISNGLSDPADRQPQKIS